MCWNALALGILTTTTGFVFLRREDGGILHMSRMFGSNRDLSAYSYIAPHSMVQGSDYTISHMLYWFTALTEHAQLIPETALQGAIAVMNAQRTVANNSAAEPQIGRPTAYTWTYTGPTSPPSSYFYSLTSVPEMVLEFKPWLSENHCGGRTWYGSLDSKNLPVVIKCWDAYKISSTMQQNEAKIYMEIQTLWGVCVPKLLASCEIGFCYAIILERVQVIFSRRMS